MIRCFSKREGGTKIAGALLRYEQIDAAPEVVFETQVPTQAQRGGGPVLVTVCDVANTVLAEARSRRERVLGIGVSTAGRVDAVTGGIAYANEIMPGWTGQPIKERLQESCELPVSVLNDVQAHALGEARWGAASGADTCMMIAAGTATTVSPEKSGISPARRLWVSRACAAVPVIWSWWRREAA